MQVQQREQPATAAAQGAGGFALRVAVAWTLAGGTAAGVLMGALLLSGRMHPGAALPLTAVLALLGSGFGCLHGAVLGRLAYPGAAPPADWPHRLLRVAYVAGAAIVALLLALLLAMAALIARSGGTAGWISLVIAIPITAGAFLHATLIGWHALEHAYARWPDNRLGTLLVLGAFALIAATLLVLRPAAPGTGLPLTVNGALIVAAAAALWIATPAVLVVLRMTRHNRSRRSVRSPQP